MGSLKWFWVVNGWFGGGKMVFWGWSGGVLGWFGGGSMDPSE